MPRERSIDIDNEIDYELAKILFKKYDKNKDIYIIAEIGVNHNNIMFLPNN